MVSKTTLPERRAGLRPISRPSQMAFGVALLAVVSGCFTYALLTDLLPYHLDRIGQIALLVCNLALVLSLATAIGWRIARLMATRRSGRAGAKLHVRLVTWFSAIAVVPVILVAIFAAVTLNLGLDQMFIGRVKEALSNAINVAQVYAREQQLQRQVQQLRIEIDQERRAREVAEITESEYFQQLLGKADELRNRARADEEDDMQEKTAREPNGSM